MIAVVTGDIVRSTKLTSSQYQTTIAALKALLCELTTGKNSTYELYRGDGYQIVFPHYRDALPALLEIKLYLNSQIPDLSVNCTQSLAYGHDAVINDTPGTSTGQVFIQSGRALDEAKSGEIVISMLNDAQQCATDIMCSQLSYVLNRLSKKQADLLYQYVKMDFPLHQVLADKNKTSRQNISERLKAAGGDLIAPFIEYIHAQQDDA